MAFLLEPLLWGILPTGRTQGDACAAIVGTALRSA
jgi:hypothetical protein